MYHTIQAAYECVWLDVSMLSMRLEFSVEVLIIGNQPTSWRRQHLLTATRSSSVVLLKPQPLVASLVSKHKQFHCTHARTNNDIIDTYPKSWANTTNQVASVHICNSRPLVHTYPTSCTYPHRCFYIQRAIHALFLPTKSNLYQQNIKAPRFLLISGHFIDLTPRFLAKRHFRSYP